MCLTLKSLVPPNKSRLSNFDLNWNPKLSIVKSKEMVEGDSKKTEWAKRGTNDGMDEEPIEEGFFDLSLILDLLL